jgi:hypothetical protein
MGIMGRRLRTGWILAVIGAVALVGACDLNPQPIPPGETDNGGNESSDGGGTPTAATGGDGSDGASKGDDGGGFNADDAGDASDASEDASDSGDT